MSRATVLEDVYLIEMKDLTYEDIEDVCIYQEWVFNKEQVKGNKFFSVNIGSAIMDLEDVHKLFSAVDLVPIFYVLTREKYLLYKLTGLI